MTHLMTRGAVAVSLALAMSACALRYDSTQLGVPTSLAEAAASPPPPGSAPFRITKHPVFLVWGAFTAAEPNLEDVLAGQVGTGTRITNLRIRMRARWSDVLITVLTAGLVSPRSVTFEGVVIGAAAGAEGQAAPPTR